MTATDDTKAPGPNPLQGSGQIDGDIVDALLRGRRFLSKNEISPDLRTVQSRSFDPWGELHRILLVEGLRQGRDHHLGITGDRLPKRGRKLP